MPLTKEDKLKALNLDSSQNLPDDYLDILYNDYLKKQPKVVIQKKKKIPTINKNSPNYKIRIDLILKVLNQVLTTIGKPQIAQLIDFKDIDRDDIIKDTVLVEVEKLYDEIFAVFNKTTCRYYKRKTTNEYILTLIRTMLHAINYHLYYDNKFKKSDNGWNNTTMYYIETI